MNENDLILIDFPIFILLKKGDKIYWKKHDFYLREDQIIECEIIYAKWLFSGEDVVSGKTHKPFYYYQIAYADDKYHEWYMDTVGRHYNSKDMYITKELFNELENRKKQKQKKKKDQE